MYAGTVKDTLTEIVALIIVCISSWLTAFKLSRTVIPALNFVSRLCQVLQVIKTTEGYATRSF